MAELIAVEVVCIADGKEVVIPVEVASGTTIAEVVQLSGIKDALPDFDVDGAARGIIGQRRPDDWKVQEYDRVEIYRPLVHDPREARRRRAAVQKQILT